MPKCSKLLTVAVFLTVGLAGPNLWAGGCHLKAVDGVTAIASSHLAQKVRSQVSQAEAALKAQGKELKVVLVARMGTSFKGFKQVKDDLNMQLEDYLRHLSKLSFDRNTVKSNGKIVQLDRELRLPSKLYKKTLPEFSHFGFLVKSTDANPDSNWNNIYHLMSKCDQGLNRYSDSEIFIEPFESFFWGSKLIKPKSKSLRRKALGIFSRKKKSKIKEYPGAKALVVVPSESIQKRLLEMFNKDELTRGRIHRPKYNVISVPFKFQTTKEYLKKPQPKKPVFQLDYQNSNQWPLEMIAAATKPYMEVKNDKDAQKVLLETNYHPTILRPVGFLPFQACGITGSKNAKRLGFDVSNLANCDHQAFRAEGLMQVISVDSIVKYLASNNFLEGISKNSGPNGFFQVSANAELMQGLRKFKKGKGKKADKRNFEALDPLMVREQATAQARKCLIKLLGNKLLKVDANCNGASEEEAKSEEAT